MRFSRRRGPGQRAVASEGETEPHTAPRSSRSTPTGPDLRDDRVRLRHRQQAPARDGLPDGLPRRLDLTSSTSAPVKKRGPSTYPRGPAHLRREHRTRTRRPLHPEIVHFLRDRPDPPDVGGPRVPASSSRCSTPTPTRRTVYTFVQQHQHARRRDPPGGVQVGADARS